MATELSGANKERTAWLAKIRRDQRNNLPDVVAYLKRLVEWGLKRDERYQARKGRLGK